MQTRLVRLQQPAPKNKVCEALLESIDETMTALLSREVVESLYRNLRTVHSIQKEEVPRRLEVLVSFLDRVFGHRGTKAICKAIAREFYAKLGLTFFYNPDRTFIEYVEEAKIKLGKGGGRF
jgi:hypothetical protein